MFVKLFLISLYLYLDIVISDRGWRGKYDRAGLPIDAAEYSTNTIQNMKTIFIKLLTYRLGESKREEAEESADEILDNLNEMWDAYNSEESENEGENYLKWKLTKPELYAVKLYTDNSQFSGIVSELWTRGFKWKIGPAEKSWRSFENLAKHTSPYNKLKYFLGPFYAALHKPYVDTLMAIEELPVYFGTKSKCTTPGIKKGDSIFDSNYKTKFNVRTDYMSGPQSTAARPGPAEYFAGDKGTIYEVY